MTERPEMTREEAAWLLALARGVGQPAPAELGMPETVRYSLLAKGCVSLGSPLQLTPIGLSIIAGVPTQVAASSSTAPVFLVAVDLAQRTLKEGDKNAATDVEPA